MANTVNFNVIVTINSSTKERRAYDDRELKQGEVLAPMLVHDHQIDLMDMNKQNIRTWHMGGRHFKVAFYPVPAIGFEKAMSQFNYDVNELLGEHRDARCLIRQADGSKKVCPKKNGENRCACKNCPHNGEYEREDKSIASLEHLMDEFEYEPASTPSAEDIAMEGFILEDLFQYLEEFDDSRYKELVSLSMNDISKDEIFRRLGVKKSQGYKLLNEAYELVSKFLLS